MEGELPFVGRKEQSEGRLQNFVSHLYNTLTTIKLIIIIKLAHYTFLIILNIWSKHVKAGCVVELAQ